MEECLQNDLFCVKWDVNLAPFPLWKALIPRSTIGQESTASQNFTFEGPQWLGLSSIQLKNLNISQNFVANNGRLLSLQSTKITVGSVFARGPSEGTYSISSDSNWISGNHFMSRKGRE